MRDVKYPVSDYEGGPDWYDLAVEFAGSGLLHWPVSVTEVFRRARGQTAVLAVPYAELKTGRAKAAQEAANWRAKMMRGLTCVSPAVDAEALITKGRKAANPADSSSGWLEMTRRYLNAVELVIIPPIQGWDQSREVHQIAEALLRADCPVYVIGKVPR